MLFADKYLLELIIIKYRGNLMIYWADFKNFEDMQIVKYTFHFASKCEHTTLLPWPKICFLRFYVGKIRL